MSFKFYPGISYPVNMTIYRGSIKKAKSVYTNDRKTDFTVIINVCREKAYRYVMNKELQYI